MTHTTHPTANGIRLNDDTKDIIPLNITWAQLDEMLGIFNNETSRAIELLIHSTVIKNNCMGNINSAKDSVKLSLPVTKKIPTLKKVALI